METKNPYISLPDLSQKLDAWTAAAQKCDPANTPFEEMTAACALGLEALQSLAATVPSVLDDDAVLPFLVIDGAKITIDVMGMAFVALQSWIPFSASDATVEVHVECANAVAEFIKRAEKEGEDVVSARVQAEQVRDRVFCAKREEAWHKVATYALAARTAAIRATENEDSVVRNGAALLREALHDMKPTMEEEKHHPVFKAVQEAIAMYKGTEEGFADPRIQGQIETLRKMSRLCHQTLAALCVMWKSEGVAARFNKTSSL